MELNIILSHLLQIYTLINMITLLFDSCRNIHNFCLPIKTDLKRVIFLLHDANAGFKLPSQSPIRTPIHICRCGIVPIDGCQLEKLLTNLSFVNKTKNVNIIFVLSLLAT